MRKIFDIHGGVHPPENKHQSVAEPIVHAGIPEEIVLPLSQHIGAPAKAFVTPGDFVWKGQMIAEANGFVSAPVHASTSGEVIAIEERLIPHPSGMKGVCIVIKPDGEDRWERHEGCTRDYQELDKKELLEIIRNAGIAGMGGAGFPSAVKLGPRESIETLIINGTECEPYITADDMLMRERAEEIIEGVKILQYLVEPTKETLIGVEDNKPEGIAALQKAAQGTNIEIVPFPTKYPSGGEKQLIQILTGKEVPSGGLPSSIGIVCQNIGTTVAIYRAVRCGEPLIERITTVTGEACASQRNYQVLLGTPVKHLLKLAGFNPSKSERLIMGGPMMGYTLGSDEIPIVKASNCILAPSKKELPAPPPAQACIRCGMCAEACPVNLLPQQMYWFARSKEHEKLEEHNLFDCIECGACSYACPSNIPLVQYYRASKAEIKKLEQEKIKAEHSKERFEARLARLEAEAAEKEAKRKARQAAAAARAAEQNKPADAKADIIAAAIARTAAKKGATPTEPAEQTPEKRLDPAQAAIERAKAKRDGNEPVESASEKTERLEKAIAAAEKRLNTSKEKLAIAQEQNSDNVAAFETAIEKSQQKHTALKEELAQHIASLPLNKQTAVADVTDPAQQAIERAKAARDSKAAQSPLEKAQSNVASLEKRLANTQSKFDQAKADNSDKLDIFEKSLTGIKEKLDLAKQELSKLQAPPNAEETNSTESVSEAGAAPSTELTKDPAQQAIERAKAARDAAATMSPSEKLQKTIAGLEGRIEKTRAKLAQAEANNDDTASILAESLEKMEAKLNDARAELEAL